MHARTETDAAIEPLTHDTKAAAVRLGIGTSTVRALIASGDLRTIRIGRRLLIPDSECVAYINRLLNDRAVAS